MNFNFQIVSTYENIYLTKLVKDDYYVCMYCVLNWFDFLECSLAQANKQTVQTLDSINY